MKTSTQCGDCWGDEGIRRLKGNAEKIYIRIKFQKRIKRSLPFDSEAIR